MLLVMHKKVEFKSMCEKPSQQGGRRRLMGIKHVTKDGKTLEV